MGFELAVSQGSSTRSVGIQMEVELKTSYSTFCPPPTLKSLSSSELFHGCTSKNERHITRRQTLESNSKSRACCGGRSLSITAMLAVRALLAKALTGRPSHHQQLPTLKGVTQVQGGNIGSAGFGWYTRFKPENCEPTRSPGDVS